MIKALLRAVVVLAIITLPSVALAAAPTTTTSAATGITTSSAVLNGAGDPNSEPTVGWFRYSSNNPVTCDDTFGTRVPAASGTDLGTGTIAVPYSITTTGLTPGVTYYFCSIVSNASGTGFGAVLSFTIPAAPVTLTTGAISVTSSSATLQGSANPVASSTTAWFRYDTTDPGTCSDTFGVRAPSSGGSALGSGTSSVDYTRGISGLLPGTTYYYCAVAQNAYGTTFGSVLFFTTPATAPTVTTNSATSITTSSAVVNATGIARGDTATGWFRYSTTPPGSCNDTFGTRLPSTGGTALGSANASVPFSQPVSGLSLATTYYVCAIAANGVGTTFGSVVSFTTSATAPNVTTNAATSVAGTSATLNASGTPNGASTTAWFRYATTSPGTCNDTFGTRAPSSSASDTPLGSGIAPVAFSRGITGLTPTTTYYFCALTQNAVGVSMGAVLSFTTPALIPTVTTLATTVTSGTSVTLNGNANPNGDATTGWFRYATSSPGTCNDTFGTRAPTTGGSALGAGLTSVAYNQTISGLTPLTTYFVCAIASNGLGTGVGAVATFTTPAAPTVTTTAASALANTSAQLNATVNPNRAATTGWFRYSTTNPGTCNDSFGSRAPTSGGTSLGSGSSATTLALTISALSPSTTYYYCAIASNSEGTSFGGVLSFTTIGVPLVTTNPVTLLTATTVTLNGNANPNGATSTGWYRYATSDPGTCSDSFGTRAPSSGGSSLGAGSAGVPYSQGLTALTPATTYYYCALASNTYGTGVGAVLSFTTPAAAPIVTTQAPTLATGTTAQLNGTVNAGGDATTAWFRYSTTSPGTCNDSFGTRAPAAGGSAIGAGTTAVAYSQGITGLAPSTTYFVCAIASNTVGTSFGALVTFTTPAPPTVTTTAASSLANTSAQLNGTANPNRAATTAWFRYSATDPGSCNDSFGSRAPTTGGQALGAGSTAQAMAQTVSGLSSGQVYYYCAIAQNSEGLSFGTVLSFTTLAAPTMVTTAPTPIGATTATLTGTANPNGATTTAWFRYSTTSPGVCNDSFGTRAPAGSGGTAVGSGVTEQAYTRAISGLTPTTTYYVCAIGSNAYGTTFGAVVAFTTPAIPPTVTTSTPTLVTAASATFNGSANPNGDATTAWFRYSTVSPGTCNDSFGTRAPATGGSSLGAGVAAIAYAQGVTGLAPTTTYYVCAIAQNSLGTSWGAVVSFTTLAAPTVTTSAATALTNTTAQLNGAADPNGDAATGWFRYSATNPGTCDDTFGTRAPATGGTALGAGTSAVSYSQALSGLTPATTYYYCALASNAFGTGTGALLTFTTSSNLPIVVTQAPTLTTGTTSTLNGTANPNGAATTAWFRYSTVSPGTCNDTFGTRAPVTGGSAVGSGIAAVAYSQAVTGLTMGTTYYVCAIAQSSLGTSWGAVVTFTTAAPPTMTTTGATAVAATTATLNGSGVPNRASTTGWFRYATTNPGTCNDSFGTRAPVTGGTSLGAGTSAVAFSAGISGLTPNTLYYVCAIGSNSEGSSVGAVLTFTTLAVPTVTTDPATLVAATTATLNGSANPNGGSSSGWFRYSATNPGTCNDSFGTLTASSALGAGTAAVPYSRAVSGLVPGTTYYYCAIANNSVGTGFGAVLQFTTSAGVPTVTTVAQTGLTTTTATLNGSANPNGAATTGWFRIATTSPGTCNDTFGTRVPGTAGSALGAGNSAVAYSEALTNLVPGTTYYYCAIASNSAGTGVGAVRTFATPAPPTVATLAATPITATTATINASGNPNGFATTGWFRYATVDPGTCDDTFGIRAPTSGGAGLGSGTAAVAYAQALTGLAPATTYYFCALASSSIGTTLGEVLSFTTPPTQPSITTLAATSITDTSATLEGTSNPNGATATGWFRYATTSPGTCNDTFGVRTPTTGGFPLGGGTTAVPFTGPIVGLTAGTTYFYCAIASNGIGTSFGTVLSFTTASAPTVTSTAATSVSSTSATLNGNANPNQSAATGWFRYSATNPGSCNDTFGTRAPTTGGTSLGAGATAVAFNQALTGLTTGVTYYYCAIASNAVGTRFGAVLSFTTSAVPAVTTDATTVITSTTATLNGTGNPNLMTSTGWFRYATTNPGTCNDTFGTRAPTSGGTALGAGATPVAFSRAITGLTASTTYYVCAIASNALGTGFGPVQSFTTAGAPTVTTDPATALATTAATLNGTATPNQLSATGWFRYATTSPGTCNDTFGTRTPASGGSALGAGTAPVSYSQTVSTLSPGTTYFYCAIASNSAGTRFGTVLSFTTPQGPTVTTAAATGVTATDATLNGTANPNGNAATGWFRYATTSPGTCNDTFGTRAPAAVGTALGAGSSAVPYSEPLMGLTAGTTYFYCAIASNAIGTAFGAVLSFTTPGAPVVTTAAATAVASTSATLNGSGNPSLATATGYFRYATTNPGTCDDTFGTRAPLAGGANLGAGSAAVAFNQAVTGLTSGTQYYYCAIASNAVGTRFGAVLSFTTTAAPVVATDAPTLVTSTTATLNGNANPNLSSATGYFRYATTNPGACNDTFGTRAPTTGGTALGAGAAAVAFNRAITGLTGGTTYYVCAIATSAIGTGFGTVVAFTTPGAPTVTTSAATSIGSTTATLEGAANPNLGDATGWFRYATTNPGTCNDTFGTRAPLTGGTALGAGSAPVPYTQAITGLTTGTTYFYCAIASNTSGTRFGAVMSFATTAAPIVTTSAPTAVTSTGATLAGSANPNLTAATGWFRYSATNPGACNDTFGTRAPGAGGSALGAGSAAVAYAEPITGLSPGTTYYVCAIASNAVATGFGAVLSFTTPAPPAVSTLAATAISSTGATLNGAGTPNLALTTGWFRYSATDPGTCDDSFGTRAPGAGGSSLGSGAVAVTYAQPLTGLSPGTTYYYCAIASNALGTRFGAVLSFVTAAAPTVVTEPATAVTATGATLAGTATANQAATTAWFRYDTTDPGTCDDAFGTRAPTAGGASVGAGTTATPYTEAVTGLAPATTYYYCAIASNSIGTSVGAVLTFTTPTAPPTVETTAPTDVVDDAAMLNGAAIPNGTETTAWFRYGTTDPVTCNDTFGTRTPATGGTSLGDGTLSVAYGETVVGLVDGTTYYYCAIAQNTDGLAFGAVLSFVAGGVPPTVVTDAATEVATDGARLNGTVNANGTDTTGWFRYGEDDPGTCDDSFGTRTPTAGVPVGNGTVDAPLSTVLTGLLPNATYYYCAAASNQGGATFGAVRSFTTVAVPPTVRTVSAVAMPDGTAELDGAANPRGSDTTVSFRYDVVDPGTCNDTFGTRAPESGFRSVGAGRDEVAFGQMVSGLAPGTYFVCAIAENAAGVAFGEVITFDVPDGETPEEGGGCCQLAGGRRAPLPPAGTLVVVAGALALLFRRRRAPRR